MICLAEYLDEKYSSGQKLFPDDLWTKAQIKVFLVDFGSKVSSQRANSSEWSSS